MGQSGQRAVPAWHGGQWLDGCGGALPLPAAPPSSPDPTSQRSPPTSTPILGLPSYSVASAPPSPPGCLPGPMDRHRHLPTPACHWPAVQPLSPSPVTASTGLLSPKVAEGRCKEGWKCLSRTPLLSPPTTAPAEPGTLPWPCPSAGVQHPLLIEPFGVPNPWVPAAPGMAHRPCATVDPTSSAQPQETGVLSREEPSITAQGPSRGPDSASRLRRWGLGSARQPAVPGASPFLLLMPAIDVASPASLLLFLIPAVDIVSPASLALTWLCHRAGFSEHSRTGVASLGERGCQGAPGEVRSPSGLPGFVSPRWSLCSPPPATVVW